MIQHAAFARGTLASLFITLMLSLSGCVVAPAAPTTQLAASRTAIDQARMAGAAESTPIEYDTAQDKLARAEAAYQAEDYTTAIRLAREAEVDAQLAQARTEAMRSQQALAEVEASIRSLQTELQRDTPPAAGGVQ